MMKELDKISEIINRTVTGALRDYERERGNEFFSSTTATYALNQEPLTYEKLVSMVESVPKREPLTIFLPKNERGELVGIDAEVINFHAERACIDVIRSRHVPVGEPLYVKADVRSFDIRNLPLKPF